MKKLYLILLSVFMLLNIAEAQKLSVESFVLAPTDITAQTEGRKDLNGDACALVKIFVVGDVADVEGNVVKPLVKKNSQTWAFMTQGSKQMQVIAQNALPLMVTFADYGIGKLESNRTYILTLNQVGGASASIPSTSNVMPSKSTTSGTIITISVNDSISIEMVKVEAGTFMMGATPEMEKPHDNEKPAHQVTLLNDYYLGKCEVTQALWQVVMGENPSYFKGDNLPVECVSWDDCDKFIKKLNQMTGKNFRLPTESEWEYAARGGNKSKGYQFSGSNNSFDVAWYNLFDEETHPVGINTPNELGIHDMSGNVYEWCQDLWRDYENSPYHSGKKRLKAHVVRGGCWASVEGNCRSSSRADCIPNIRSSKIGLRLALSE